MIDGCDYVFHLAAQISISKTGNKSIEAVNLNGTENVVNVCIEAKINRLIHFSSIHAFSQFPLSDPLDENRKLVLNSSHKYDLSKAKAELVVKKAVNSGKLDAIILNPTCIIGPYDFRPSLMGSVLIKLFENRLPALVPGGYDWVDVRDVCNAALSAMENGLSGNNYILSGCWLSFSEISTRINKICDYNKKTTIIPSALAMLALPYFKLQSKLTGNDQVYTLESFDILKNNNRNIISQKARSELNFLPRSVDETLSDIYHWFQNNNFLKKYNHP